MFRWTVRSFKKFGSRIFGEYVKPVRRPKRGLTSVPPIGAFALLNAEAWPAARILACECDPENVQLLRKKLQGHPNVEIMAGAVVGEEREQVDFHAIPDKFRNNSGGGSCYLNEPEV